MQLHPWEIEAKCGWEWGRDESDKRIEIAIITCPSCNRRQKVELDLVKPGYKTNCKCVYWLVVSNESIASVHRDINRIKEWIDSVMDGLLGSYLVR